MLKEIIQELLKEFIQEKCSLHGVWKLRINYHKETRWLIKYKAVSTEIIFKRNNVDKWIGIKFIIWITHRVAANLSQSINWIDKW